MDKTKVSFWEYRIAVLLPSDSFFPTRNSDVNFALPNLSFDFNIFTSLKSNKYKSEFIVQGIHQC